MLGGVADTVAQLITAFKARSQQRAAGGDDFISIEIHDLDKQKPPAVGELGYARTSPPPFDFERLTRFMAYGFFMAPVQFQWFGFLSRAFPLTKKNPTVPALKRVAFDQLIFAPFGMGSGWLAAVVAFALGLVLTCLYRSGLLLHLHDDRRRRREESIDAEIPRRVFANSQGQLCAVAGCTDSQLPGHSHPVPDCKLTHDPPLVSLHTNPPFSLLFRPLELRGPHTSRSPTPRKRPKCCRHGECHVHDPLLYTALSICLFRRSGRLLHVCGFVYRV